MTAAGSPVLVVIDWQEGFLRTVDRRRHDLVPQKIRRALADKQPVVVVGMPKFGTTASAVIELLQADPEARYVMTSKTDPDGSQDVIEACLRAGFPLDSFELCGLYLNLCVQATGFGLMERLPVASVVVDSAACVCSCKDDCGLVVDLAGHWQFC